MHLLGASWRHLEGLFGGLLGVSVVREDSVLAFTDSMMLGTVDPEEGGLVIGAVLNFGPVAALTEPFFQNNVYIDLNEERLPATAYGEAMEFTELYWGDGLSESELGALDETSDSLDFDGTWTMATTADADSPLYGLGHPVLSWQCEYDTSIICDTLD